MEKLGGKNYQISMNYSKFEPLLGDWGPKLKSFIESSDCDEIYKFLKAESDEGKLICPAPVNTFRAFRETPFNNLRCIFILQDPYHQVIRKNGEMTYVADGMAMSCGNTGYCQPSLELFYKGMEDDLGYDVIRQPDLSYLAKQGILLLNSSLTVEMDKPGSHSKIGLWDKFNTYLIEEVINFYTQGLIYVSFGQNAQIMTKSILPFLHWGFELEHPAFAARKERDWKHQNIFTKINKILKDSNNEQINWAYGTLDSGGAVQSRRSTGVGGKLRKD